MFARDIRDGLGAHFALRQPVPELFFQPQLFPVQPRRFLALPDRLRVRHRRVQPLLQHHAHPFGGLAQLGQFGFARFQSGLELVQFVAHAVRQRRVGARGRGRPGSVGVAADLKIDQGDGKCFGLILAISRIARVWSPLTVLGAK